jgi:hypothetical protein
MHRKAQALALELFSFAMLGCCGGESLSHHSVEGKVHTCGLTAAPLQESSQKEPNGWVLLGCGVGKREVMSFQ